MLANIPRLLYAIMTTEPGAPWCLDLFCGAGGAGMGYKLAGFNVLGVDVVSQPRYPGWFVQADALEFAREYGHLFDMIHASPPCQRFSALARIWKNDGSYNERHPDLIADTRFLLDKVGAPYVIENVPGSPLNTGIVLCGAMFDLKVYRHRLFESNILLFQPGHIPHCDQTPSSGRGKSPKGFISVTGNGGAGKGQAKLGMPYLDYARQAMGINWQERSELSESIPPAYTHYVGKQMMRTIVNAGEK